MAARPGRHRHRPQPLVDAEGARPARTSVLVWRGLRRRCPRCGSRGVVKGLFALQERCPRCGIVLERHEGFSLGSITINMAATMALVGIVVVGGMIVTYPDIAVVEIVVPAVILAIVVPILFYGNAQTIWAAADLAMRPLEPAEIADAALHAAAATRPGTGPPTTGEAPTGAAG